MKKISLLKVLFINLLVIFVFAQAQMFENPNRSSFAPSFNPVPKQRLQQRLLQTATTTNSATATLNFATTNYPTVNLECMKNAILNREEALKSARENQFNKVNQAYEERKNSLLNAWTIQNLQDRQKAIKDSWLKFQTTVSQAKEEYRKKRVEIWQNFINERKKCRALPTGEDPNNDILNL